MKVRIISALLLAVIVLMVGCASPKLLTATAANLPAGTVPQGEAVLFRFNAAAEGSDMEIEKILCIFQAEGVSVGNLRWYDDETSEALSGASFYSSEGKFFFWPGWPHEARELVVAKATTKTFSLRAEVTGKGFIAFRLQEVGVESGKAEGFSSVFNSLTVN